MERRLRKVPLIRVAPWPTEEEMEALEKDPEIKRLFKKKPNRCKLKIDIKDNDKSYCSSESDITEESIPEA